LRCWLQVAPLLDAVVEVVEEEVVVGVAAADSPEVQA
jgi:hypothetical protein